MHKKINKQTIGIMIGILVVGVLGGFLGGVKYQASKVPNFKIGNTNRTGAMMRGGNGNMGTMGEVLSRDASTLTVKLPTGGSKIVFFDANTSVVKASTSTLDAVVVGEQVVVGGTTNADGSVSAKTIQIR